MKFVKRSICLPEDLHKFAEKRARDISKGRGHRVNFSAAIAEMVMRAKLSEIHNPEPHKQAA